MSGKVAAALVIAVTCSTSPAGAQVEVDPAWFGLWRVNLEKSIYRPGPPPYIRATYRIEPHANGVRVVYDMVRPRRWRHPPEWTGQFDGRDYPVQGVEEFVTYAYQQIDARTYEVVTKLDGRPAARSSGSAVG